MKLNAQVFDPKVPFEGAGWRLLQHNPPQ